MTGSYTSSAEGVITLAFERYGIGRVSYAFDVCVDGGRAIFHEGSSEVLLGPAIF
jgi:hypothetical protein